MFGMNLEAIFHDPHTGRDIVLALAGDWMGYNAVVTVGEGGPAIAQIQREFKGRDFFGGQTVSFRVFECGLSRRSGLVELGAY